MVIQNILLVYIVKLGRRDFVHGILSSLKGSHRAIWKLDYMSSLGKHCKEVSFDPDEDGIAIKLQSLFRQQFILSRVMEGKLDFLFQNYLIFLKNLPLHQYLCNRSGSWKLAVIYQICVLVYSCLWFLPFLIITCFSEKLLHQILLKKEQTLLPPTFAKDFCIMGQNLTNMISMFLQKYS